jgi:hypothetical protein
MELAQLGIGHPAEEPDRTPLLLGSAFEPAAITAVTGDEHAEVRMGGCQSCRCIDEYVEALAGHQTTEPQQDEIGGIQAETGADRPAMSPGKRREP